VGGEAEHGLEELRTKPQTLKNSWGAKKGRKHRVAVRLGKQNKNSMRKKRNVRKKKKQRGAREATWESIQRFAPFSGRCGTGQRGVEWTTELGPPKKGFGLLVAKPKELMGNPESPTEKDRLTALLLPKWKWALGRTSGGGKSGTRD